MPLKQKLIRVGNSRAVIIPAKWLNAKEDKVGKKIENILIEVNNVITISVDEIKLNKI